MQNYITSVLAALGAAASLCAQGGLDIDGVRQATAPLLGGALGEGLGGGRGRVQDPDYSLEGLFQQAHGDYMLKRDRYTPMVDLNVGLFSNVAMRHEPGDFDLYHIEADIKLPIITSTDSYLVFGGYFDERRYDFHNINIGIGNLEDDSYYGIGAHLGFGWFLDSDVLFEFTTSPGLWSDLDGTAHSDDYDIPTKALFTWRTSEEFFFKAGARYNQVFEDAPYLPYLGFSWQASESLRVDVLLPEMFEVSLWPSSDFGLTFGGEISGAEYRVRTSQALGDQTDNVNVQEIVLYVGAQWRFTDALSMHAQLGAAVAGDYELTNGSSAANPAEGSLEAAPFVRISVGIDF